MACYRIFGHGGDEVIIQTGDLRTPVYVWSGEEWEATPRTSWEAQESQDIIRIGLEFAFGTEPDLEESIARARIEACDDPSEVDITDEQIGALRREAREAGDEAQVEICERALEGDDGAWDECIRVTVEARGRKD